MNFSKRTLGIVFSTLGILFGSNTIVFGWGTYVPLESVVDFSLQYSGEAALAEDASTNYGNPAGLLHIKYPQLLVGGSYVNSNFRFIGTMSNPGFGAPIVQSGTAKTTAAGLIPSIHYAQPITSKIAVGLSLLVPYGLGLDYSTQSIVRYDVITARQRSFLISPGIAYQLTPQFSIGFGPDILYYTVQQRSAVRTQPFTPQDSSFNVNGSSWTLGGRIGALYEFTPCTRVGVVYHTQFITHNRGSSHFNFNTIPERVFTTNNAEIIIPQASIAALSAYHEIYPNWAIMASIKYLGWHIFANNRAENLATPNGSIDSTTPRKFRDGYVLALGSAYTFNEQFKLRGGISYMQGSTTDQFRDIFITDPSAYNFSVGAHYQPTRCLGFDLAYGGAFFKTVHLNHLTPGSNNLLVGRSKERTIGTFAGQVVWNFV